jgi:hypothetical protein
LCGDHAEQMETMMTENDRKQLIAAASNNARRAN